MHSGLGNQGSRLLDLAQDYSVIIEIPFGLTEVFH